MVDFSSIANISLFGRKFRFTEKIVPLDKELYVLGTAVPVKDNYPKASQQAIIKRTKNHDQLLISDKREEEINKDWRFLLKLGLGGLGIVFSLAIIIMMFSTIGAVNQIGGMFFILGLSVFMMYKGFKEMKRQQISESLPTSKIRSLSMGLVEVKGAAKPIEGHINAPFTGRKCLGYYCKIEEYVSSGKNSHWRTLDKFEKYPLFYVEDDTGAIPVNPKDADFVLDESFKKVTTNLNSLPKSAVEFIKDGNVKSIRYRDNKRGY